MHHTTKPRLALAIAAIAAATVTACGNKPSPESKPAPAPVLTTVVDGPDADTKRDDTITLVPAVVEATRKTISRGELDNPLRDPGDRGPVGQPEGPLAADELPGCRTRFVQNYSSRNGVRPRIIVWHQTVSYDRPGYADQDALTAYANQRSSGVSWAAQIGGTDGLCTYNVPLALKAWTQANANSFSVGLEVQAYGTEPQYVTAAGKKTLLRITREIGRRYDIPMQRGKVVDCVPVRPGIVEHSELGPCGGGHSDVTPWSTDALIAELKTGGVTITDRVTCRKLNAWRNAGRPQNGKWRTNSIRRRHALDARGVTCTPAGPVKT